MNEMTEISGFAPPAVKDAFAANFEEGGELGARFSAIRDGELVADLWAGFSDRAKTAPWTEETLVAVYSSGKAAMTTLVAEAVSEGALDYERAVADDWPDFAAGGKERVTLADVLSHQAGLCGFPEPMPPEDWIDHAKIAARLAAMTPLWRPGTASGYHPQTVGFIVNELLRRTTSKTVGARLREKGHAIHCGMTDEEIARTAFMTKPPSAPVHRDSELTKIAFLKPWSATAKVGREEWMRAEIPASNMHATAKALAEIVHPLANGGVSATGEWVIDASIVDAALKVRITGEDLVLPFHLSWTAGLMANTNGFFGPSTTAFGHAGFGGSAAMIDPARRLSAGYAMNRMSPSLAGDPRAVRLFESLY